MGNNAHKFVLLMWKNWTLLLRSPFHTLFEIIYPVLICAILVLVRCLIKVERKGRAVYHPFKADDSNVLCSNSSNYPATGFAYSPSGSDFITRVVSNLLQSCPKLNITGYQSSQEMNEAIDNNVKFYATIQFGDDLRYVTNNAQLPPNLNVVLRFTSENGTKKSHWFTNLIYPVFQSPGPRAATNNTGGEPSILISLIFIILLCNCAYLFISDYMSRGFLCLQQLITMSLINNGNNLTSATNITLNRYPYPSWMNDTFYSTSLEGVVSLLMVISFVYNFINTIRAITTEKEKQLKESMKIMGLPGWLHWVAWFLRTFIILLIAIVLMVIILKINFYTKPVFTHSDGILIFVFLTLFACSSITFTFLISVFFSKANTAASIASLSFLLAYLPYYYQIDQYDTLTLGSILGSSILANSALSFGLSLILRFEAVEEGIQWSNVWKTVSPDDNLKFGYLMIILILDALLYMVIALYVEAIFPGDFGVPQPWYFPVSCAYWCNKPTSSDLEPSLHDQGEYFEEFTENLPKGIELKNLSKTFGNNKAVKKLNLDMYEGHITVLLGHNGAGKTTTMSMITGMFPPTQGTAIVNGYDVRTSTGRVRDSMGLCLQHNVLFDDLTVIEHLYFFGKLKGLKKKELDAEINNYLKLLELDIKRNALSKTLSGGTKRKLSVAIALCGKSKVVMLDEPTAGMDPSARRTVWNLLQKQKHGRTILLTTHFMDEADLLGDRIAIMTSGILQCCGSSFFLKRKYGTGYKLIMDVSPECVPQKVTDLLRKYIPNLGIYSRVGSELTYQLSERDSPKFESMLSDLEGNITQLKIRSYGVSLTTLEEVFMKVGADNDRNSSIVNKSPHNTDTEVRTHPRDSNKRNYLRGSSLMRNQFVAMSMKKFLIMIRTWLLFVFQVLVPVGFVLATLLNTKKESRQETVPLEIKLDLYRHPRTLIDGTTSSVLPSLYKRSLTGKISKVPKISETILRLTKETPSLVKSSYIVGASFDNEKVRAWFNGDPYHSSPLALGLILNALYKEKLGEDKNITFINHPLPLTVETQIKQIRQPNAIGFQLAFALGYGMAFVASFYALFCIKERVSKSKHLQFVSGMNVYVFWGTSLLCDLVNYLITITAVLITIGALQQDGLKTPEELGRLGLVLICFGFSVLPFVYLLSYFFRIPASGFTNIMLIGLVTGIIAITVMQVLESEKLNLQYVARPLDWVLLFIPFYSICKGIYDLSLIYTTVDLCSKIPDACKHNKECCDVNDYFSMGTPGIGRNVLISLVTFVILFGILIANEYGIFSNIINKIFNYNGPPIPNANIEEDVQEEIRKIRSTSETTLKKNYILVLRNVTKYYGRFLAVNGLCVAVKPYECFGLLGVNGAGKTSTFKMMTGDEQISFGDVWVNGMNIKTQQKEVQKLIGYCPQFDALLDDLTVRQTLKIFALIRGVPYNQCNELAEELAHEYDFYKHIHKRVKHLSGGNKRKLSTALALIGDPPVIYLDEPTTGMDPVSKRYIWNALGKLRDSGKCIILTSHSMEECEALCTRIAIMVNGSFQCLGSTQRLKNKFAQGYSLTVKVKKDGDKGNKEEDITAINDFIQANFPGAQMKERYQQLVSYQLPNTSMPWSRMFGILEKNKRKLKIEDYSLGQCSLEEVFLSFTKYQLGFY